jgi:hypothetical protein
LETGLQRWREHTSRSVMGLYRQLIANGPHSGAACDIRAAALVLGNSCPENAMDMSVALYL